MSWFRRLLQQAHKPVDVKSRHSPSVRYALEAMPTIKFDPSVVTKSVKADLQRNVELLAGVEKKHVKQVYELALRFIVGRRDFYSFCTELMNLRIEGMTRSKAAEIGRSLANKAGAVIDRERQGSLGITHAIWRYANAPCMKNPSNPTDVETRLDAAHRAVNGKQYEISKGLFVGGKWTWPGVEEDCKCISRSIIPGLERRES
ncbi:MAG: hypothetical protein WBG54_17195 [Acidobacteriaceae bacterium]